MHAENQNSEAMTEFSMYLKALPSESLQHADPAIISSL